MLGRPDLERAGIELEQYMVREVEKNCSVDAVNVFSFAVNALVQTMQRAEAAAGGAACDLSDLLDILGVETSMETGADLRRMKFPLKGRSRCPHRSRPGEMLPLRGRDLLSVRSIISNWRKSSWDSEGSWMCLRTVKRRL